MSLARTVASGNEVRLTGLRARYGRAFRLDTHMATVGTTNAIESMHTQLKVQKLLSTECVP